MLLSMPENSPFAYPLTRMVSHMYARNLICSHSLTAAALHSALVRSQAQP